MAKLTVFASLASEIDKFQFETESAAQKLIDDNLVTLKKQRDQVMDQARKALTDRQADITELAAELDKIGLTVNSPPGTKTPPPIDEQHISHKVEENVKNTIKQFEGR